MSITSFVLKDGRNLKIDFSDIKSLLSVSKKDWKEVGVQLKEWEKIVCTQLSGEEVYDLLTKGKVKKNKSYVEFLQKTKHK